MSEAVVPHKAEQSAPRRHLLPGHWLGRAIDSDIFYSFRRSRLTMVAAAVTVLFFLLAIFAPLLAVQNPFDPAQLQLMNSRISPIWTADGQTPFLLGTDEQGRDVFSAILYGLRISLTVGVLGVLFSGTLGIVLGLIAGYVGGAVDGLKLAAMEKEPEKRGTPQDLFIHSELMVFVDKQGRLRGSVETDDPKMKSKVLAAVKQLLREKK